MTLRVAPQERTRWVSVLGRVRHWLGAHHRVLLWLVLLLGFALRLWRLAAKNIWWDEASSAWQAPMSLAEIALYQARDQHPPLYYWLLHYWNTLSGSSLFALRLFSAAWGTLGVAIAYALGKRVLRFRSVALIGAFFLAISRFHIEWSQEIKMYAMTGALSMLWLLLGVQALHHGGEKNKKSGARGRSGSEWHVWLKYGLVGIVSVYSHYISLLSLASQNLYALLVLARRWRDKMPWRGLAVRWGVAQAAVLAVAVPWFFLHAGRSSVWQPSPAQPLGEVTRMVTTLLSVGTSLHVERYTWRVVLLWVPLLATLLPQRRDVEGAWGSALLWIALLIPWFLTYLLTLPVLRLGYEAKIAARFFILCQTPYSLLLASALIPTRRWSPWAPLVGVLLVVTVQAGPLLDYYRGRYLSDEYTTLARTIQAYGRQGEAILLHNDSEWPIFHYAYQGELPHYHVPSGASGGEELVSPYIAPAWEHHDGVWLVTIPQAWQQDPGRSVSKWLAERGHLALDERYGERHLTLYRKEPRELFVSQGDGYTPQHRVDRALADGITLVGYDQALDEVRTGRSLRIVTLWRLENQGGPIQVWAALLDRKGEPIGEPSETSRLAPNGLVRARTDIPISTMIQNGRYRVRVHMGIEGDDTVRQVDLGSVRVIRTMSRVTGQAQHPLGYRLGEAIRLVGYDLDRTVYAPGEQIALNLYWRAEKRIGQEYAVFTHILGQVFNPRTGNPLWGQVDSLPLEGKYPTSSWLPGDTLADDYLIPIDQDAPLGSYELEIGLYSPDTGVRLPVYDASGQALGDHIILERITVR